MKSVPSLLFFRPMKEEPPEGYDCHYNVEHLWKPIEERRPYWVFEYWHGEMFRNRPAKHMCGLFTMLTPYRPGEKCYVPEAWCKSIIEGIIYKDGYDVPDAPRWRSPATMPAKYARRFVTVLSCEPVRIDNVTEEDCLAVGLKKLSKDNGRTWKYGMADRDGLPGTDNTGWAWEDWKVDHREAFKIWWNKDKEWAWRVESQPFGIAE